MPYDKWTDIVICSTTCCWPNSLANFFLVGANAGAHERCPQNLIVFMFLKILSGSQNSNPNWKVILSIGLTLINIHESWRRVVFFHALTLVALMRGISQIMKLDVIIKYNKWVSKYLMSKEARTKRTACYTKHKLTCWYLLQHIIGRTA